MMNKGCLFKYTKSGLILVLLLCAVTETASLNTALAADDLPFSVLEKQRGLPTRGQPSATVLKNFGDPASKKPAVGDPPISRWNYADFVVYFEYDHVITTVVQDDKLPTKLDHIR